LQLSAENAHRDQRAAAHKDHLDIQAVLGKDSGIFGQPNGQKVGRIRHREADVASLLRKTRKGDARDEEQYEKSN
jgi:hypothetical protein